MVWRISLAGLVALTLAACLQGANAPDRQAHGLVSMPPAATVALLLGDGVAPYLEQIDKGARAAAQANHVEVINVDRRAEQASEVERLLGAGVGALVFVSASGGDQQALRERVRLTGVPMIAVGAVPAQPDLTPYVAIDDERSAYLAVSALLAGASDALEIAVLESSSPNSQALARQSGIDRALAEHGRGRVIARLAASGKIDQAYEVTRELFAVHRQIDLVIGASDAIALGALKYLRDSRRPRVRVAGFGALPEARAALAGGGFALTVDPRIEKQVYLGVEYAARSLRGDEIPPVTLLEADLLVGPGSQP